MALALGEDRDQDVGASHLLTPGRLDVDHGALNDPLEAGCRLGVLGPVGDQVLKLGLKISDETAAQFVQIDIASAHDRGRVLVLDERQQQMLKRGVLVMALIGERQGTVERLFETA